MSYRGLRYRLYRPRPNWSSAEAYRFAVIGAILLLSRVGLDQSASCRWTALLRPKGSCTPWTFDVHCRCRRKLSRSVYNQQLHETKKQLSHSRLIDRRRRPLCVRAGSIGSSHWNRFHDQFNSKFCVRLKATLTFITGPPTHSVGARLVTVAGVCRRLLSVNSTAAQRKSPGGSTDCGSVVLRPVRAKPVSPMTY